MEADFYTAMFPCYASEKALGLAVFHVEGQVGRRSLNKSPTLVVYNALAYFLLTLGISISIYLFNFQTSFAQSENAFYWFAEIFDTYINYVLMCATIVPINVRGESLLEAWRSMLQVDCELLRKGGAEGRLDSANRRIRGRGWAWLITLTVCNVVVHVRDRQLVSNKNVHVLGFASFFYCLTDFYKTLISTTFWAWLSSLAVRFEILNEQLGEELVDLVSMREVREMYAELCSVTRKLNRIYTPGLLVSFAMDYFLVVFQLYEFSKATIGSQFSFDHTVLPLLWILFNVSGLVAVVTSAEILTNQTRRIKRGLLQLTLTSGDDPQMRETVRTFAFQLLHDEVKITAAGFFNVDLSFMYTVVGAGTTFLVILTQFDRTRTFMV